MLTTIGDSLREAFFMLWETLWAIILGFTLSGAVQAFVSRHRMQRVMGDHRPAAATRSSLLGMASSSCSYAATALAKSLFRRGADFTSAMVFMFASTNLVVELGIVLWLLIGWQFALAEFFGGAIMIILLTLALPRAVPEREIQAARARLERADPASGHEHHAAADESTEVAPLRARLRRPAGWADAAGYTIADLAMLRREIVIGFVAAGFVAVAIPTSVWNAVFLHGHGALTMIENAIVGPFVAIVSFVCSIGNVPLAAALWHNGSAFGGVVAFVFADLLSLPLLLIYRKLYGARLTVRLVAVFWLVMSTAGVLTELLFDAAGIVPTARATTVASERLSWNYTTVLNIVFLLVFAAIYWLHRNKQRFGGGRDFGRDPVCGMQVERRNPGATSRIDGDTVYFCSDKCRDHYLAEATR